MYVNFYFLWNIKKADRKSIINFIREVPKYIIKDSFD